MCTVEAENTARVNMKKGKKVLIIALSAVIFISLVLFGGVYFLFLHRYHGREIVDEWAKTDEFFIEETAVVYKQKDKDFVILNLADVQLCDLEDLFRFFTIKKEIEYLVKAVKPDLITLTGDQTWSNENLVSLKRLIGLLESFGIPYAPVFGNHDYGNEKNSSVLDLNKCCDLYESAKNCLFKRGPSNLGALGNYVIRVEQDGEIVKTIYMLDSGYEEMITSGQIEWVRWNAEGFKQICGYYPESLAFMHKPLPEYRLAFDDHLSGRETSATGSVEVHYSVSGSLQNGFFDAAKELNFKDVVCGHQHGNNFTLSYKGVRLTFALKTGELGGYYEDESVYLNGATVLKLGAETKIESVFVDADAFKIN